MSITQVTLEKRPRTRVCRMCCGAGLVMNGEDVAACRYCGGDGEVIARDKQGRFLAWHEVRIVDHRVSP